MLSPGRRLVITARAEQGRHTHVVDYLCTAASDDESSSPDQPMHALAFHRPVEQRSGPSGVGTGQVAANRYPPWRARNNGAGATSRATRFRSDASEWALEYPRRPSKNTKSAPITAESRTRAGVASGRCRNHVDRGRHRDGLSVADRFGREASKNSSSATPLARLVSSTRGQSPVSRSGNHGLASARGGEPTGGPGARSLCRSRSVASFLL